MIRVLCFNWPFYLAAAVVIAAGALWLRWAPPAWTALVGAGLAVSTFWFFGSLAVSFWVYDRSPMKRGAWLEGAPVGVDRVAIFHAGHDEASEHVRAKLETARVGSYDFFDSSSTAEASLLRARKRARGRKTAQPVRCDALPLDSEAVDLAVLVFALHELRRPEQRSALLGEVRRVLRCGGRLLVVEHLRDLWNFLAYGPGVLHFLPESAFRQAFADGGLVVVEERRFTPFVRCYTLERAVPQAEDAAA